MRYLRSGYQRGDLVNQFYSLYDFIVNKYEADCRSMALKGNSTEDFYLWQKNAREKLKMLLGLDKMQPVELSPLVLESVRCNGYRREKVLINTQKDVQMPMYILIPDITNGIPAIALHGHGSDGKNSLVGIIPEEFEEKINSYNYTYALELMMRGYIVFCPDLAASGERREQNEQGSENAMKSSCTDINNSLISIGMTLQGVIVYDLIRLIDYIKSYSHCNSNNVICCGFSGGALSAWLLSALEDRVSLVVGSGYFHGFKDTILYSNRCSCNFIPNLWKYFDLGDLVALSAPKPIYIEVGDKDNLNGRTMLENVYSQIDIVNKAYDIFGKSADLHIEAGGHSWYGKCFDFIESSI